jgi:FeS assembly SUF system protein
MVWNPFSKGRRPEPGNPVTDPEPAGDPEAVDDLANSAMIPIVVSRDDQNAGSGSPVSSAIKANETARASEVNALDVPGAQASDGVHAAPSRTAEAIREDVIGLLRTVFDPEIPVNVYELGLVYEINVTPPGDVHIRMTLTSPACPVAGSLPPEVETKVASVSGVTSVKVELVWDPPWSPDKMSEAARLQLNV